MVKVLRLNKPMRSHKMERAHDIGYIISYVNDVALSHFPTVAWEPIGYCSIRQHMNPEPKIQEGLQSKKVLYLCKHYLAQPYQMSWFWQELILKSLQLLTCSALHNIFFHIMISVERLMKKKHYGIRANRSNLNPLKASRACAIDSFFPEFALFFCAL